MRKPDEGFGTTTALIPGNQPTGDQRSEGVAKHTPGPWYLADGNEIQADRPNDDECVCVAEFVCTPLGLNGKRAVEWQEAKANARLIAAAPDMLAALKVAINEIHHPGACAHERGRDITDFLEAIIAKAEGR